MIMINFFKIKNRCRGMENVESDFDKTFKSRMVCFASWEMGGNSCLIKNFLTEISSQTQSRCLKTLEQNRMSPCSVPVNLSQSIFWRVPEVEHKVNTLQG